MQGFLSDRLYLKGFFLNLEVIGYDCDFRVSPLDQNGLNRGHHVRVS